MSAIARTSDWQLATIKGEARVDSRQLAQQLGKQHKTLVELIERHISQFRRFGIVPFQTEKLPSRGRPERFALLNENQAYLLLTFSRNTEQVVDMKVRLIEAFAEARANAQQHATEYLPSYHKLHDAIGLTAAQSTNQRHIHCNFNKLVNKAAGIGSGQRQQLTLPQQSMLAVAQHIAAVSVAKAGNHKAGYAKAKTALRQLNTLALGGAA